MGLLRSLSPWLGATGLIVVAACAGGGCYRPTQATLVLETDVPCATVGETAISIGADAEETETSPPQATARTCVNGHIGTLVLVPSGARDSKISVRVVTGANPSLCTKANNYGGCIVARRSVRYIEHQSLRLPIVMRESCRDVPCSSTETCVRDRCVPSTIAPESCLGDGCTEDALLPGPDAIDGGRDAEPDGGSDAADAGCVEKCVGRTRTTCTNGQAVDEFCATPCDAGCATVTDITAGAQHTCALLSNGDVYCWGRNIEKQLGVGAMASTTNRPTSRVALPAPARSLHGGSNHTCVITRSDEAFCWGDNVDGQIDLGGTAFVAPTRLSGAGAAPVVTLAAGTTFTCAGGTAGLVCQGSNGSHELGREGPDRVETHVNVPVLLAAGNAFGCMTQAMEPTPRCWGNNGNNQLGRSGAGPIEIANATDVTGLPTAAGVQQVVAGPDFACALSVGQVFCWGAGPTGQLGGGASVPGSATAVHALVPGDGVAHVAAATAGAHVCAVKSGGATYCWGLNVSGQISVTAGAVSATPVLVTIPLALRVAGGNTHTCALLMSREIFCWGRSTSGQLGNGSTDTTAVPPAPVAWP